MMLSRDVRRRWLQYGESRKVALGNATWDDSPDGKMYYMCCKCNELLKKEVVEIDHVEAVGPRPRIPQQFGDYIERMIYLQCQVLCKKCHLEKTNAERKRRKK